jgi:UDP-2-acetamido-2-deoxy-ribo-hexuluronate aminotransferase
MQKMVDLHGQYLKIKNQINHSLLQTVESSLFIGGEQVKSFGENLANYLGIKHVIPCANGTDALQIAMMALDLKRGDEVIVPAFTYVATAEVIALLGLKPIMIDVSVDTFNIDTTKLKAAITPKTKAIVPVHLFGQSADMEAIMKIAKEHNLFVIEDNAQAIGGEYILKDGTKVKTGTLGHIGCTSFFPSKNLGCYGDGGAIYTNDTQLAEKIKIIANHGQNKLYHHSLIGVNSRLDAIQAGILNCKLPLLNQYNESRQLAADFYDKNLLNIAGLHIPKRSPLSTHVFHQYTLKVPHDKRDNLKVFLEKKGIPSMIYYPIPLYKQLAYKKWFKGNPLPKTEELCKSVISLPMHTELTIEQQTETVLSIHEFFKN